MVRDVLTPWSLLPREDVLLPRTQFRYSRTLNVGTAHKRTRNNHICHDAQKFHAISSMSDQLRNLQDIRPKHVRSMLPKQYGNALSG